MKKALLLVTAAVSLVSGVVLADRVRDWHDLEKVHAHIEQAMHEMDRARAANHYDMDGHGAKAEELLRQAEHELHLAVDSAKQSK